MMNFRCTVLATVFLGLAGLLAAQEKWTLEQCIRHAQEHNLQVRQRRIEVEQAGNRWKRSRLDWIPSFSASLNQNLNWGRSVDLNGLQIIENRLFHGTNVQIGAHIALVDGLSKIYRARSERIALQLSRQQTAALKNEISLSITRAFLQLLLAEEIYRTKTANYQSVLRQKERTSVLVEAGRQAYSSLLEIEAQVAEENARMIRARHQIEADRLTLLQLLDLPYREDFGIRVSGTGPTTALSEDIGELFLISSGLPQIRSAELALEESRYRLKLAKGRFYPTLTLTAAYGTYFSSNTEDSFFTQFRDNRNPSLVLGLNIPIFNRRQTAVEVKNARLELLSHEIGLEQKKQKLYKDIQMAVTEAAGYLEQLKAAESNLRAMEVSFNHVEEKFAAGTLNGTDYATARTRLTEAQSRYLQARYQLLFQMKIIDFYKGVPLSL